MMADYEHNSTSCTEDGGDIYGVSMPKM